MIDYKKVIETICYAPLGGDSLPKEILLTDGDFLAGLLRYFKYVPKIVNVNYIVNTGNREVIVPYDSLYPNGDSERWYYIGNIGLTSRQQLGQTRFDEYLLGMQYSTPVYDPLQRALANAIVDFKVHLKFF